MLKLSDDVRQARFRAKIITDTEKWLGRHLADPNIVDPRVHDQLRRVGILIEAYPDEQAHLDSEPLGELVDRLSLAAERSHRGDVLLDLTNVRSTTATFVRIVDALIRFLACQGRRLIVDGADGVSVGGVRMLAFSPLVLPGNPIGQQASANGFNRQVRR